MKGKMTKLQLCAAEFVAILNLFCAADDGGATAQVLIVSSTNCCFFFGFFFFGVILAINQNTVQTIKQL